MLRSALRLLLPESSRERLRYARKLLWDAWHDVDTTGPADIGALKVVGDREHSGCYESSTSSTAIIADLQIDHQQFAFIDFGSGKGRVLLEASSFPFRSVQGVEFSVELHKIAEANMRRYRRANVRSLDVRSILANAAEFELPTVPLVLYFFNPFSGPLLETVINNICRSAQQHPRDIFFILAGKWMSRKLVEQIPHIEVLCRREYYAVYRLSESSIVPVSRVQSASA